MSSTHEEKAARVTELTAELQDLMTVQVPKISESMLVVQQISKKNITELKALWKPPAAIGLVFEAVCTLLGESKKDWYHCQHKLLKKDDFLQRLVNFDKDRVPDKRVQALVPYLARPDFSVEQMGKSSLVASQLCAWVIAVKQYADAMKRATTLQAELQELTETPEAAAAEVVVEAAK